MCMCVLQGTDPSHSRRGLDTLTSKWEVSPFATEHFAFTWLHPTCSQKLQVEASASSARYHGLPSPSAVWSHRMYRITDNSLRIVLMNDMYGNCKGVQSVEKR